MRTTTIEDIPCWATQYLYYGDDSGISEDEKKMCDDFVKELRKKGYVLIEPDEESHNEFNSWPAFGLPCDTEDWVAEVLPKKKKGRAGNVKKA